VGAELQAASRPAAIRDRVKRAYFMGELRKRSRAAG
jgi:hypothetical protein